MKLDCWPLFAAAALLSGQVRPTSAQQQDSLRPATTIKNETIHVRTRHHLSGSNSNNINNNLHNHNQPPPIGKEQRSARNVARPLVLEPAPAQVSRQPLQQDRVGQQVSAGSKAVLSVLLAIVLLALSSTMFDFVRSQRNQRRRRQRQRPKGYDDIHSQDSGDANTESMLINETDSDYSQSTTSGGGGGDTGGSSEDNHTTRRLVRQIFFSFSLLHSFAHIFHQPPEQKSPQKLLTAKFIQHTHEEQQQPRKLSIDSLHGLRFLSMIWIIIIHTYSFAFQWSFFKSSASENIYKTAASQLIANGAFACDSFFLIGGFLLPYLTFPAYSPRSSSGNNSQHSTRALAPENKPTQAVILLSPGSGGSSSSSSSSKQQQATAAKKLVKEEKFKFTFARLCTNLLHRYLRMMPLMMAIIGLSATLLRYLGEGPAWDYSTQMYDKWCRKNWWINGLFLHNFLNTQNMCLSHSWYAAVDLQLFLFGQVILFILARSKWLGILTCCLSLFGGQLITALITLLYHLPALPLHTSVSPASMSLYYGEIYIKPYCRASPYLIGILLAYLMRTTSLGQVKLKRWQVATGWTLSIFALLVILLSTLPAMNGQPPGELESALYNALSRPLWACATGWMVFACITNHGGHLEKLLSWRHFIPFSRLSYSAFLVHPIVMAISYGGRTASVPFSHYLMLCLVLGNIVITYASAFLLSSLFELPLLSVERALKQSWSSNKQSSC